MHPNPVEQNEFGALVEPYRRQLHAHCYRLMGSLHDAEDMVQETLLRAWRNRESLQEPAALRAWLYKIATNICLDALRKHRKRFVPTTYQAASTLAEPIPADVNEPIWLEPYPDDLLPMESHHPEEHVLAREHITLAFIASLQLLPPRQRAILILRDVMDFQASEVADLLGSTVASVKSALHRARATLAERGDQAGQVGQVGQLDDAARAQLDEYVRAWEYADVNALIKLLADEATFSMPPIPAWYQGKETIRGLIARTIFAGPAAGRWRLLPTRANRQVAFGLYRVSDTPGTHSAYGIQVITFCGGAISDITTFRDPALVVRFGLPQNIHDHPRIG